MQNEHTMTGVLDVDAGKDEALELHLRIRANLEMAATSLLEACRGLKEMKEGNRYRALGYERFEDYTESALGIKSRQAYYYIQALDRLGPQLVEEHAGLGITKLRLLTEVSPLEREDFLDSNDLAGMSVKEIEAAVKERNGLREQLSLFQNKEDDTADERSVWLENQLEAEKEARATLEGEMAEKLAAEREDAAEAARAELEKKQEEKLKEARREAREKAEKAAEKKIASAKAEAEEAARAELEQRLAEQVAAERAERDAAAARAAELEKKLEVAASAETTAFALLFEQQQEVFTKMLAQITALAEKGSADQAAKLENALRGALARMGEMVDYAVS